MRRQLRLSTGCAISCLGALLGMPMLHYWMPATMRQQVGGVPLSWLVLAIVFFPFAWAIAGFCLLHSMPLEEVEMAEASSVTGPRAGEG